MLDLLPMNEANLSCWLEQPHRFEALTGFALPQNLTEFPEAWPYLRISMCNGQYDARWGSYYLIWRTRSGGTVVGLGGYKGRPDAEGWVEIGYEIAPDYRKRGLATTFVRILLEHARHDPYVRGIIAHTLPEENPSVMLLRATGFQFVGAVEDPDDGTIWRWERPFHGQLVT